MSQQTAGVLVSFLNKDGATQKGVARYVDQKPRFSDLNKVFIRLLDADLNLKLDERGRGIIAIKPVSQIKQEGFVD